MRSYGVEHISSAVAEEVEDGNHYDTCGSVRIAGKRDANHAFGIEKL